MIRKLRYTLLFFTLLILPAKAIDLPAKPQGAVADFANVLSAQTENNCTMLCQALWNKANFALIIATVPSIGEESIEEYAVELYKKWGIGSKTTDEGTLVLLSLNPRKVRIEVGYGAEGYLNDAKTGRLLDTYALPFFKQNDFDQGILALSVALAKEVAQEKQIPLEITGGQRIPQRQEITTEISPIKLILFAIILIIMLSTRFGRTLLFWLIMSSLMGGRRGGGGFGGGLGGGGFGGGFGGGMSGGGGSSRSF